MRRLLSTLALASIAIAGTSAKQNVKVWNDNQSYYTSVDSITFQAADSDTLVSIPSLQEQIEQLKKKVAELTGSSSSETTDDSDLESLTALQMTVLMGNGINLGNTFDAYGNGSAWLGYDKEVSTYETCWGQPLTTKAMIDGYKAAGFKCVRIPVSWINTMDFNNGDLTISADYLSRVKEVVDWAIADGLYVILNDHHDGSAWQKLFSTNETLAWNIYESIWNQVGEYFKDEPLSLILESANEQLCADGLGLSSSNAYTMTNKINQKFVDMVRAQGSNNAKRFLLIAGYATNIDSTISSNFVMPTDIIDKKLMVSVHYYTPYQYADMKIPNKWGGKAQIKEMNSYFAKMKTFVDKGYGVIFGEYSATTDYQGNKKVGTEEFITNVLDLCDYYNFVPLLWDCNDYYNKTSASIKDAGVAACFSRGAISSNDAYNNIQTRLASAPDYIYDTDYTEGQTTKAVAYISYANSSWSVNTAVCNGVWNPDCQVTGVTAETAEITGDGEYTVSLDFTSSSVNTDTKTLTGTSTGITLLSLAITNGNSLLSGKTVTVTKVNIDGTDYALSSANQTVATANGTNLEATLANPWAGSGINKCGDFESAVNNCKKMTMTFTVK